MRCKRCRGLIVVESRADGEFNDGITGLGALRCVNCGVLVDLRMLRNRAACRSHGLELAELVGDGSRKISGRVHAASCQTGGNRVQ